jgi:hypothetical protein
MRRKSIIKSKREIIERTNERRVLVRFAKDASANAKRASEALNISYDIIKDNAVYQVYKNSMIKTANIKKVESDKYELTKGSVVCLK